MKILPLFKPFKSIVAGLLALLALSASAQIGGSGWTPQPVTFTVQWPYNLAESARYSFTNGVYHMFVLSTDKPFNTTTKTLPRTEQRFPDYTSGEIQYQAMLMAPANENSYCVFQIHTSDDQEGTFGSTAFMLFWFSSDGGSVHDYSGTELAKNLGGQWFQLNADHNLVTHTIKIWVNNVLVWTQTTNGATDFYMKDGVYEQSHGPTLQMDTDIKDIQFWTSSGKGGPSTVADPVFSPAGGTYTSSQIVSITSATSGALFRYTTDGSTPTETVGTAYSGPVNISATATLKAIAYKSGSNDSAVTSSVYTISPPPQPVAAPTFSPDGGKYTSAQNVSISSATSGASFRYTTDGSTPSDTAGIIYSNTAISISTTTTLKAIAYKPGFTDSTVTSATYTFGPPPTLNFEAASLSPVGTGATVSTSNDTNVTGGLLEFLNSTAVGQSMTLTTPSIPAGTYQVQFRYKTNTSRAQHNVKIDGAQVGGTIDQYAKAVAYPTATLGTVSFATTATHTIVLTVTGKDSAATQFYITADKFTFVGQ
jgi:hypothetical protein